jgi:DNA-binding MarR family transcriptional regulator
MFEKLGKLGKMNPGELGENEGDMASRVQTLAAAGEDSVWLSTAQRRAQLEPQRKPYWYVVEKGLHLGYYRGVRAGTWHARRFVGGGRYEETRLGTADDDSAADGSSVLSLDQALSVARSWRGAAESGEPATQHRRAARGRSEHGVRADRLDEITAAWKRERPDLDLRLVGLFMRIERAHLMHEQRMGAIAESFGVAVGELHVLLTLRRQGRPYAARPTDLFRSLLVTSGAITKRIDRLESAKLVRRETEEEDLRSFRIVLTGAGIRLADDAIARIAEGLAALSSECDLSADEFDATDIYMRRILAGMPGSSGAPVPLDE